MTRRDVLVSALVTLRDTKLRIGVLMADISEEIERSDREFDSIMEAIHAEHANPHADRAAEALCHAFCPPLTAQPCDDEPPASPKDKS